MQNIIMNILVDKYDWGIRPLQNKLLDMLKYFHCFCQSHNIEYCLAYGTALGAKRHKGFIPWDDDVDVYMTSESYDSFKKAFNLYANKDLFQLQELDSSEDMIFFAKLRLNGTTYIEPLFKNSDIHQGIYIDIFILHNAPSSTWLKLRMYVANLYLVIKSLSNRKYNRRKMFLPIMYFLRIFPRDFLRKFALSELYKYDNLKTKLFFDCDLRKFKKAFYDKEVLFPSKTIEFEDTKLCGPSNIEKYLLMVYGDYNKLPSFSSIQKAQHAEYWSIDMDYKEYLKNNG